MKPENQPGNRPGNQRDGWIAGRIYCNREDKRIIVKRPRSGFGYAMNFGNAWTWILHAIAAIAIVILFHIF